MLRNFDNQKGENDNKYKNICASKVFFFGVKVKLISCSWVRYNFDITNTLKFGEPTDVIMSFKTGRRDTYLRSVIIIGQHGTNF